MFWFVHFFMNNRFVMSVLFAFIVNAVVVLLLMQRRLSGLMSQRLLYLLAEAPVNGSF